MSGIGVIIILQQIYPIVGLKAAIAPGLTLACLGSIDTLLTSVVADNITKTKHNSNKELIGQGIGNAVAGLFCGISGAGATMRTVFLDLLTAVTKFNDMIASVPEESDIVIIRMKKVGYIDQSGL